MTPELHRLWQRLHGPDRADADAAAREVGASRRRVVAVSACLLGEPVRYDGRDKLTPEVAALVEDPDVAVLPVCPEVLGGMGCPRRPVHFSRGDGGTRDARVVDDRGRDQTGPLMAGAARADELARLAGAEEAIMKERSPSCGVREVHGPTGLGPGRGALTARLERRGLRVRSEEDVVKDPDPG